MVVGECIVDIVVELNLDVVEWPIVVVAGKGCNQHGMDDGTGKDKRFIKLWITLSPCFVLQLVG